MGEYKTEEIKVRVASDIKDAVQAIAKKRRESESVIVREAVMFYLDAKRKEQDSGDFSKPKKKIA